MYQIWFFKLSYYVNTIGGCFVYKYYKPHAICMTQVPEMAWVVMGDVVSIVHTSIISWMARYIQVARPFINCVFVNVYLIN